MMKNYFSQNLLFLFVLLLNSTAFPQASGELTVKAKIFNYPVLKGKEENPVMRIKIDAGTEINEHGIFTLNVESSKPGDVAAAKIYFTGTNPEFDTHVPIGEAVNFRKDFPISDTLNLEKGENYFWVSLRLAENADLTSQITVNFESLKLGEEEIFNVEHNGIQALRTGVALRQQDDDGVDTYRIPGLTTSKGGTLLATYDVRYNSRRDLQGHMDIGVSRSTDGGNTWEPMKIALDMNEFGGLPEKFNGVSDASILVDEKTGDIYLAGLWMHGVINSEGKWIEGLTEESDVWNHQWRNKGSQPGFGVKETSQFLITKSTDDGKTWNAPVNLTESIKEREWWLFAPGPGRGLTLKDGTLVFPTQGRDATGVSFSNITFSKDGGITWETSNPAATNTTEAQAVQLSDGNIMLNMRDNRNAEDKSETNGRNIAVTTDLGKTWKEHHTSRSALIEPRCMASLHSHDYVTSDGGEVKILLFSNPNSKFRRHKQTIKMSLDDGNTWPERYWVELDEGMGSGYSCLTSINNETIGIVYEGSQAQMTFQVLRIEEVLKD